MKRFITLSSSLLSVLLFSLTAHSSYSGGDLKNREGKSTLASSSAHIAFNKFRNPVDDAKKEVRETDDSSGESGSSDNEDNIIQEKIVNGGIKNRDNVPILTEEDAAIDPTQIEQRRVEKPFRFKIEDFSDSE